MEKLTYFSQVLTCFFLLFAIIFTIINETKRSKFINKLERDLKEKIDYLSKMEKPE